jgi:hypothetical protein
MECNLCGQECLTPLSPPADHGTPYAFHHLLPAGILRMSVQSSRISKNNLQSEDGWHTFIGDLLVRAVATTEDETMLRSIDFLVFHRYVSVTYRVAQSLQSLLLRFYIIPCDLVGVGGKLRVRPEATVASHARKYMSTLFPLLEQSLDLWNGCGASSPCGMFLPRNIVRSPAHSAGP